MFRPNKTCIVTLASSKSDVYGRPLPGRKVRERCSVVFLNQRQQQTSVRADSSASRGNAQEAAADAKLLFATTTKAAINDIVEVAGAVLKISGMHPRFNVRGDLDHYEVDAHIWSQDE
ncbi:hypothetical protein N5B55_05140 [Ralstonia pickettii]|uniref:hypothetical protein n=1 Tax=Ralstonia pickettii TaxID=329 RepID=UPI0027151177|nr:hypothetical protein [Ralstonia pickettii]WKZ86340.1 hypothetical protein N5B55_05140 [Ralstonia pickettii]